MDTSGNANHTNILITFLNKHDLSSQQLTLKTQSRDCCLLCILRNPFFLPDKVPAKAGQWDVWMSGTQTSILKKKITKKLHSKKKGNSRVVSEKNTFQKLHFPKTHFGKVVGIKTFRYSSLSLRWLAIHFLLTRSWSTGIFGNLNSVIQNTSFSLSSVTVPRKTFAFIA